MKVNEDNFLFHIKDGSEFNAYLQNLINEIITKIIKGEKIDFTNDTHKTTNTLKLHSELFISIGTFENSMRNFIISEMPLINQSDDEDWYKLLEDIKMKDKFGSYSSLLGKLRFRKNKDEEKGFMPESELIYYADIDDYKRIIVHYWKHFEPKFNEIGMERKKFEFSISEFTKLRNKVMHLRNIRTSEDKNFRFYILPELEKVVR
jgi:hypothetical protein